MLNAKTKLCMIIFMLFAVVICFAQSIIVTESINVSGVLSDNITIIKKPEYSVSNTVTGSHNSFIKNGADISDIDLIAYVPEVERNQVITQSGLFVLLIFAFCFFNFFILRRFFYSLIFYKKRLPLLSLPIGGNSPPVFGAHISLFA